MNERLPIADSHAFPTYLSKLPSQFPLSALGSILLVVLRWRSVACFAFLLLSETSRPLSYLRSDVHLQQSKQVRVIILGAFRESLGRHGPAGFHISCPSVCLPSYLLPGMLCNVIHDNGVEQTTRLSNG